MARRQRAAQVRPDQSFKGRQFTAEVILWAVRWYLMFPISYRDLELMLADRGVNLQLDPGLRAGLPHVWGSSGGSQGRVGVVRWREPLPEGGAEGAVVDSAADL